MSPAVLDRPALGERLPGFDAATGRSLLPARRARPAAGPLARAAVAAPAVPVAEPAAAPSAARVAAPAPARAVAPPAGGPATVGGVIAGAWRGLATHREVGCPICGGHMAPRYGAAGVAPVGGRCTDCGTTLG